MLTVVALLAATLFSAVTRQCCPEIYILQAPRYDTVVLLRTCQPHYSGNAELCLSFTFVMLANVVGCCSMVFELAVQYWYCCWAACADKEGLGQNVQQLVAA